MPKAACTVSLLFPVLGLLGAAASAANTTGNCFQRRLRRPDVAGVAKLQASSEPIVANRRPRWHPCIEHGSPPAGVNDTLGATAGRTDCRQGCTAGCVAQGGKREDRCPALLQCQVHAQLEGERRCQTAILRNAVQRFLRNIRLGAASVRYQHAGGPRMGQRFHRDAGMHGQGRLGWADRQRRSSVPRPGMRWNGFWRGKNVRPLPIWMPRR